MGNLFTWDDHVFIYLVTDAVFIQIDLPTRVNRILVHGLITPTSLNG